MRWRTHRINMKNKNENIQIKKTLDKPTGKTWQTKEEHRTHKEQRKWKMRTPPSLSLSISLSLLHSTAPQEWALRDKNRKRWTNQENTGWTSVDRSTKATLSTYNTWIQLGRLQKIYHSQSPKLRLTTIAFSSSGSLNAIGPILILVMWQW